MRKESPKKIEHVKRLLNKSFTPGSKMFRLAITQRPDNFKPSQLFLDNFKEGDRIIKLGRRMAFQMFEKETKRIELLGDWVAVKSSSEIYSISTMKNYLKKRQNEKVSDPTLNPN